MSNTLRNEVSKLIETYYNKGDISDNISTVSNLLKYNNNVLPTKVDNVVDPVNNTNNNTNNNATNNATNNIINDIDSDEPSISVDGTGKTIYNGWTDNNITTVRVWKINLFKSVFIYNFVLEKYRKLVNNALTIAMILGYVTSILNGITAALLAIGKNYVWVSFGLSISTLVISTIITILNSILQIRGWSDLVSKYSVFVDKIDNFYSLISNLLILPDKIKANAVTFIKTQNKSYLDITMQSPTVYSSDYESANNNFVKYIKNESVNYAAEQKYCQNDTIIDLV